jgi:ABC-2 type transport system permease protein
MSNILTITRRELSAYFLSPIAYVIMAVFAAIYGFFFNDIFVNYGVANIQYSMSGLLLVLLFMSPLMTMRALSEERKMGTDELLLTSPVSTTEIILGKFMALGVSFLLTLALLLIHLAIVLFMAQPDLGPIVSSFIGLALVGLTFIAIGLFTSSFSDNQIISGLSGFGILFFLWLIDWLGDAIGGKIGEVLNSLSMMKHFEDFNKGVIDTVNIIFYISFMAVFLFLTIRQVEARRWR